MRKEDLGLGDNPLQNISTTRRRFLGATGIGIAALVGKIWDRQEIGDSVRFLLDRKSWKRKEDAYFPSHPDEILSKEASGRIFDTLGIGGKEGYSTTITREAFHEIIQRPARIAGLYFNPDKNKTPAEKDKDFVDYSIDFFTAMEKCADYMDTDFIATLLMYQISGDANSSQEAFNRDVMEERLRVGLNMAEKELGPAASDILINILRELQLPTFVPVYYAMPRLEGFVTTGIHDVETVMIARSLRSLEETLPDKWSKIAEYLKTRAPEFFAHYRSYADLFDKFEEESEQFKQDLIESSAFNDYLAKFYSPEIIRAILTSGDYVDPYQLKRTTLFWANVAEISVRGMMQVSDRKRIEEEALNRTIQQYMEAGSPIPFFLDQILNPKMLRLIEIDADRGNATAQELLARCKRFDADGQRLIVVDRELIAVLAQGQTEQDVQFQLVTGQAYVRMLLYDTYDFTHGQAPADGKIKYSNPDELAYDAFMANGNRENAPTYQLAGTRPLHRATLTYRSPEIVFNTMRDFIEQVYKKVEGVDPQVDFGRFSDYFFSLLVDPFLRFYIGLKNYYPFPDTEIAKKQLIFLKEAENFGVNRKIITPPHSSWMRAFEAVISYINSFRK